MSVSGSPNAARSTGRHRAASQTARTQAQMAPHCRPGIRCYFSPPPGQCSFTTSSARIHATGGACALHQRTTVRTGRHRSACPTAFSARSRTSRCNCRTAASSHPAAAKTVAGARIWNGATTTAHIGNAACRSTSRPSSVRFNPVCYCTPMAACRRLVAASRTNSSARSRPMAVCIGSRCNCWM